MRVCTKRWVNIFWEILGGNSKYGLGRWVVYACARTCACMHVCTYVCLYTWTSKGACARGFRFSHHTYMHTHKCTYTQTKEHLFHIHTHLALTDFGQLRFGFEFGFRHISLREQHRFFALRGRFGFSSPLLWRLRCHLYVSWFRHIRFRHMSLREKYRFFALRERFGFSSSLRWCLRWHL